MPSNAVLKDAVRTFVGLARMVYAHVYDHIHGNDTVCICLVYKYA